MSEYEDSSDYSDLDDDLDEETKTEKAAAQEEKK